MEKKSVENIYFYGNIYFKREMYWNDLFFYCKHYLVVLFPASFKELIDKILGNAEEKLCVRKGQKKEVTKADWDKEIMYVNNSLKMHIPQTISFVDKYALVYYMLSKIEVDPKWVARIFWD